MALLSWADLSYVLPVTSVGYVLAALAGRLFLSEQVSPARWAGDLPHHGRRGIGWPHPSIHARGEAVKWLLVALIVAATTAGQVLQAIGMRRHGEVHITRPGAVRHMLAWVVRNEFVIASVGMHGRLLFRLHVAALHRGLEFRRSGHGGQFRAGDYPRPVRLERTRQLEALGRRFAGACGVAAAGTVSDVSFEIGVDA